MSFNIKVTGNRMSRGDINYTADMIEKKRREEEEYRRRRRVEAGLKPDDTSMDNALGLVVGLATGIPINTTPGAIMGAVLHHATEERQSYTPPAPSYDSGSSSSSYDSGSSSGGGSFDTGGSF